jgi:2-oxo-4-hydroxy-4-carboxy-5-ureidoimidazoline decarboxylase
MNPVLEAFNGAEDDAAFASLMSCCASRRWAHTVATLRPFKDEDALFVAADSIWVQMQEPDRMEAFHAHPRIGERKPAQASAQSKEWSSQEQAAVHDSKAEILAALAAGNLRYEELFGFTYIVCATGKSAEEMFAILKIRLANDRQSELQEAVEQQRQITQIRLRKWLQV